jgi:hypothetical protein
MNKIALLITAFIISFSASAKIWRVNNNAGINADFTTLQAAHNGAASGDTIYVEGSANNYGGLTCTKKLHIIGTGYFLDENQNLQANALVSRVGTISFSAGSSGSVVEGLSFEGSQVYIHASNIVIRRNHFGSWNGSTPDWYTGSVNFQTNVTNILITQNFAVSISSNSTTSTGILITNNYISAPAAYGEAWTGHCLYLSANTIAIVKNNIFRRARVEAYNSNLSNNIMYNGTFSGTGNLTSNNIANGTQFGSANGNQENVSMAAVFELTGSSDARWKLKAGSPAIGAGYGSTSGAPVDCGMFGGNTPYVLSGIPPIPSIYYFANQPVGSNSDPIDVQIKVRSNN